MNRTILLSVCALVFVGVGSAADDDPILANLEKAKKAYLAEMAKLTTDLVNHWLAKEEAARKDGSKAKLDAVKAERKAFEEAGEYPATMPKALQDKLAAARKAMGAAYDAAIKACVKASKDAEAEQIEKQKEAFYKSSWAHLNTEAATAKEDYLQLPPNSQLPTKAEYVGPIEIAVTARTERENIRIAGPKGFLVIFNWELNPNELRIHRPDGDKPYGGSQLSARTTPLKPNTWYRLRVRITAEGVQVFVNDQLVFSEKRKYELAAKSSVWVKSEASLVDVKDLRVTQMPGEKK